MKPSKTSLTKNNVVALRTSNNKTLNHNINHELELTKVEEEIKSYLERVEFYIEEPNSEYLKQLQARRTELVIALKSKTLSNESKKPSNHTDAKVTAKINSLEKKINSLESTVIGLTNKLMKERTLRINMHTRLQTYRQEIYRHMYESKSDESKLNWIKEMIDKDPTWGLKNNVIDSSNNKKTK